MRFLWLDKQLPRARGSLLCSAVQLLVSVDVLTSLLILVRSCGAAAGTAKEIGIEAEAGIVTVIVQETAPEIVLMPLQRLRVEQERRIMIICTKMQELSS